MRIFCFAGVLLVLRRRVSRVTTPDPEAILPPAFEVELETTETISVRLFAWLLETSNRYYPRSNA